MLSTHAASHGELLWQVLGPSAGQSRLQALPLLLRNLCEIFAPLVAVLYGRDIRVKV
jgi:hypothetical protein